MIVCPHCDKPFDEYGYNNIQETETEVVDDRVYVTTTYWCPHCKGYSQRVQYSEEIRYWYENPIEAI